MASRVDLDIPHPRAQVVFGGAALVAVCDGARVGWTAACLGAVAAARAYRASLEGAASPFAAQIAQRQRARLDALEFAAFAALGLGYCAAPRRAPARGDPATVAMSFHEVRLRKLLLRRAPGVLHKVDTWLDQYKGREAELEAELERLYPPPGADGRSPEPSPGLRAVHATTAGMSELAL